MLVLAMGRPMLIGASLFVMRTQLDHTVVSVGPYMFHNESQRSISLPARSAGKASPPHRALSPQRPDQPASISMRQVEGVACITLMARAWINSDRARPSMISPRVAITTQAPLVIGSSSSSTAMSNESVVTASRRSSAASPGSRRMLERKFATARCGTQTPFGLPVEPEV